MPVSLNSLQESNRTEEWSVRNRNYLKLLQGTRPPGLKGRWRTGRSKRWGEILSKYQWEKTKPRPATHGISLHAVSGKRNTETETWNQQGHRAFWSVHGQAFAFDEQMRSCNTLPLLLMQMEENNSCTGQWHGISVDYVLLSSRVFSL